MKTVHALALKYIVTFYPIFLILHTYVCIILHDNNFRPVVWLWKPFHRHFAHLRRWDSTASIINAFTTFLLLSFSKIFFAVWTHFICKSSPSFCTPQDCPEVVSCWEFCRWHALNMFAKSFQGEYKDAINGTCDFRIVSASFFILRILTLASLYNNSSLWVSALAFSAEVQGVLLVCSTCIYAVVRPYKHHFRNNADILTPAVLEATSFELFAAAYHPPTVQTAPYHAVVSVLSVTWYCCSTSHIGLLWRRASLKSKNKV